MDWLNDNPVTEDEDVDFLIKMVTQHKTLATHASTARKRNEEALDDWKGKNLYYKWLKLWLRMILPRGHFLVAKILIQVVMQWMVAIQLKSILSLSGR